MNSSVKRYRVRRYRPRIEGLFARVERWTFASRQAGDALAFDIKRQHPHCLWARCALTHHRPQQSAARVQLADLP